MPAVSGVTAFLYVNTGTSVSPTYTKVAGQRGATLNRAMETIDTTTKDDYPWKTNIASWKEWSVECEALLISGDGGYNQLLSMWANQSAILVRVIEPDGSTWTGNALLTEFPVELPHDDAVSLNVTLQGTGALTKA